MARRDVDQYYAVITSQYQELLRELESLKKEDDIAEDIIEDVKKDINIIKSNRDRWVYMMYLLDRPKRKEKAKRFDKSYLSRMKEKFGNNSAQDVVEENEEVLERVKEWKIS